MTVYDYFTVEKVMEAWYLAGKLDATGSISSSGNGVSSSAADTSSHRCKTVNIGELEYVTKLMVESGEQGVSQISFETNTSPLVTLGEPDATRYGYLDSNWETFSVERELFGLWGYVDQTSGDLNALGFVYKDNSCVGTFLSQIGPDFTWTSVAPGVQK